MKFFLLFLTIALFIGYLFGEEEYERVSSIEEISKAPGFALAKFEKVIKTESKRGASYRARFGYEVDGRQFHVSTSSTTEQIALRYAAQEEEVQVAYSTRNPAVGTLKRYYDLRDPRETVARAMMVVAVLASLLASPIALGISWRLGWFRRKSA